MSRSNRIRDIAFGLAGLIVFLVGLVGLFQLLEQQKYSEQTSGYAAEDQAKSSQNFTACDRLPTSLQIACIRDAFYSERDAQRANEDVDAQKYMANAAFWTWLVSWAQALVAVGGIYFIARTMDANRLSTDAAVEMADLARKGFVATHRPRVVVRFIQEPFKDLDATLIAWVTVANIEVGTAHIEALGSDIAVRNKKSQQWREPGLNAGPEELTEPIVLTSGERYTFTSRRSSVFTREGWLDVIEGTDELCLVGELRYRDENGALRFTSFFRVYDLKTRRFLRLAEPDDENEYCD